MSKDITFDGVVKSELRIEQDHLVHEWTQPAEDLILERNNELRKNEDALRDLGEGQEGGTWGRQVASIPFALYYKAIRDGFDLNSKDSKTAEKEMWRFLQTPEGKTCIIQR